jgi:hypothetical protein
VTAVTRSASAERTGAAAPPAEVVSARVEKSWRSISAKRPLNAPPTNDVMSKTQGVY